MVDQMAIKMEGWLEWSLISRSGIIVASGEQHNLILNQGLDYCFQRTSGLLDIDTFAVVGTGSTAPAVGQTGLVAEVARTSNSITQSQTRLSNYEFSLVREREFDFAQANGNLTEWGFSPVATVGGNLAVRELFRDAGGNPITITKTSSQKLRLKYTRRIQFGPTAAAAFGFNITNLGAVSGNYIAAPDANNVYTLLLGMNQLIGLGSGSVNTPSKSAVSAQLRDAAMSVSPWAGGSIVGTSGSVTAAAYIAGTFTRSYDCQFATGEGNGNSFGLYINSDGYAVNGNTLPVVGFRFAASITKTNLQTLSFTGLSLSLGRA